MLKVIIYCCILAVYICDIILMTKVTTFKYKNFKWLPSILCENIDREQIFITKSIVSYINSSTL